MQIMRLLLTATFLSFCITSCAQKGTGQSNLNLDFEKLSGELPNGWTPYGEDSYHSGVDSSTAQHGKYSVQIVSGGNENGFKAWTYALPQNYEGKKITLSGFIKTENVRDGYAGLWLRIDPDIGFDNMNNRGITGTKDWTRVSITLDLQPAKTKAIVLGGLLTGKGKMWMDNLSITIDGKDIEEAKIYYSKKLPADLDTAFSQGSGIQQITLNEVRLKHLKKLALVWGFLKYYHPNVAKGQFNFDNELFRVLPKILKCETTVQLDSVLNNWIISLGSIPPKTSKNIDPNSVMVYPDLNWIQQSGFSKELQEKLLVISTTEHAKEHYYIGLTAGVGNPEFKNEKTYTDQKYPDAGLRLLALFRYWNMIQYYFPYKHLIGTDWKEELQRFLPKILNAGNEEEYTLTLLELIASIHDTHANIWGGTDVLRNSFGTRSAPVGLAFQQQEAIVTENYDVETKYKSSLLPGDRIVAINGNEVTKIVANQLKWTPASNYTTQLREIADRLLRSNDTVIDVRMERNGQIRTETVATFPSSQLKVRSRFYTSDTCFKLLAKDIAYLNNGSLKLEDPERYWPIIKTTKGLVLDLRNYPSTFILYELSKFLLPQPTAFAQAYVGSISKPGLFTYVPAVRAGTKNKDYYKGKVVILVNEYTQSSAEFHAMAYRMHPNAVVLGSQTAAADGNVSQIILPGGIVTMISGIGILSPDGKETQRTGITPDVYLTPSRNGIIAGKDELIEKAIQLINSGK